MPNNEQIVQTSKSCVEQDTRFNLLFVLGCAVSNIFGLIFGYILVRVN